MSHKTTINDLHTQQAAASKSFWRYAATTAVSVTVFTVSAIALDMGVAIAEAATLQVVAAISAAGSIGGAAFAQGASSKIDRIESEIDAERTKEIERTTKREVAPAIEKGPAKEIEQQKTTTKHIDAATAAKSAVQQRER